MTVDIEKSSKSEMVYAWVRARIMDGAFAPRDRLNADQIARELGVSKIPVREAIQRLSSEGLVSHQRYSSATVAALSWVELAGIRAARSAIEPAAASIGAKRRTTEQVQKLKQLLDLMDSRLNLGQLHDFFELNRAFHLAVSDCSGLPVLSELTNMTLQKVARYRAVLPISLAVALSDLEEHRPIVEAIEAGDSDAAAQLIRQHVTGEHTITGHAHTLDHSLFSDSLDEVDILNTRSKS